MVMYKSSNKIDKLVELDAKEFMERQEHVLNKGHSRI